jgi:hypothetical protein
MDGIGEDAASGASGGGGGPGGGGGTARDLRISKDSVRPGANLLNRALATSPHMLRTGVEVLRKCGLDWISVVGRGPFGTVVQLNI